VGDRSIGCDDAAVLAACASTVNGLHAGVGGGVAGTVSGDAAARMLGGASLAAPDNERNSIVPPLPTPSGLLGLRICCESDEVGELTVCGATVDAAVETGFGRGSNAFHACKQQQVGRDGGVLQIKRRRYLDHRCS